ncbi:MAG: zf-HC2 domain-containing protein [Candidatus Acidiferrum sp.]
MSCELTQSVLHGYLDGELDAARAADFERHLISCSQCASALETQETLRTSIQQAGLYERAPSTLRRKIESQYGVPAAVTPMRVKAGVRPSSWQWLAVAAALFLAVFLGWRLIPGLGANRAQVELASAIVDAHLRSLQPGHLEDVVSTDQHTVKPWFDGKVNFAPPVRDFAGDGFPLEGGRLDVVEGREVAVLVYGRRKHVINVFVWPMSEADTSPQSGSQLGYNWISWRKAGMEMYAVSDVSPADLDALRKLLSE